MAARQVGIECPQCGHFYGNPVPGGFRCDAGLYGCGFEWRAE